MDIDPPHSEATEQAVLSVVLDGRHPEAWSIVRETCRNNDYFFSRNHKLLALCFDGMELAGISIDAQTVATFAESLSFEYALRELSGDHKKPLGESVSGTLLEAIGGRSFIGDIADKMGSVKALVDNCESLATFYRKRQMIATCLEAVDKIKSEKNSDGVGDTTIAALAKILAPSAKSSNSDGANQAAQDQHDMLELSGTSLKTGSYGIQQLDELLPLRASKLITAAAAPGCGKTSLALMAACNTAKVLGPHSVAFASIEMSAEELAVINLCRESRVPKAALENGKLSRIQRESVKMTAEEMKKYQFYILDSNENCTVDGICSWIRQKHIASKGALHLVCLDYLQLIDAKNNRQTEREILVEASRALKKLSRQLNVCILALSQMNALGVKQERDKNGRLKAPPEPRLTDLHGSSTIGKDSDGVLFITPKSADNTDATIDVIFKIEKNRGGRQGSFGAEFRRADGQRFVTQETGTCVSENRNVYKRMESTPQDSEDLLA